MTKKDAENIEIGNVYYKQSRYDCKSCYKVEVVELLNDKEVMVKGLCKKKKSKKEAKSFRTDISSLHKSPDKAVGGYKKRH